MMEEKKLKLRFDPYAYVRVKVMKSRMLSKDQYHKLMKMDLISILRFLEETEYKKAVDRDVMEYKGLDAVEHSLNDGLVKAFEKVRRITNEEVNLLINVYLKRWDLYNIKTILRSKLTRQSEAYALSLLIPAGAISMDLLKQLIQEDSLQNIFRRLDIKDIKKSKELAEAVKKAEETKNMIEIENILDKNYFNETIEFAGLLSNEGSLFKEFLQVEIDIINIKNLLRFKREGMDNSEIKKHLLYEGAELKKNLLERLAESKELDELMGLLRKTLYGRFVKFEKGDSLIDIELELDRYWLKKSNLYSHQNPLSVLTILGFMLEKEMEVRNLKALVKARQLGIEQDFIENKLIV